MDAISLSSSRNQLAVWVETVRRVDCFRHRQKQSCMRTCSTFVFCVDRTVVFSSHAKDEGLFLPESMVTKEEHAACQYHGMLSGLLHVKHLGC